MMTRHLTTSNEDIRTAGELLRSGQLVAIPTETVYGLAANAYDAAAVASVFEAKGRPQDNPLIVHISHPDTLRELSSEVPETAWKLAESFWPGALTIIVPRSDKVPAVVSPRLSTVAVRLPSHPAARAIINAAGVPLAAPSANLSGSPSPTTAARVAADMDGRIAAIVDGGACDIGVESTVISLCETPPRLLRPGGITPEQLCAVIGEIVVDDAILAPLAEDTAAASPGMKYQHYAPRAAVTIVRGTQEEYIRFVNERRDEEGVGALCFDEDVDSLSVPCVSYGTRDDAAEQGRRLFEALRTADDHGITTLYAAAPSAEGVGLAVYNRLLRAAGFREVTA